MQYRNLLFLALSLGLTITIAPSISLAKPAATTIAANSNRLNAPKLIPDDSSNLTIDQIVQNEATWLKRKPSIERHEKLLRPVRELQVVALESSAIPDDAGTPSKASISYFGELMQKYPQSGAIATLYAASVTSEMTDDRQIEQVYDSFMGKHPNHPGLLGFYSNTILQKYAGSIPTPLLTKLQGLYDRQIAQHPNYAQLYLERARLTPQAPAILKQWQAAVAKVPNNPEIANGFSEQLLNTANSESPDYPKTVAIAIQQVEAEIKQNPQSSPLYELYKDLHQKAKTPKKALPILQAGFAKGAEAARLNYLIGDAYLLAGEVDSAIRHYQKVVQAKTALCWGNMTERFEGLKTPEQQRAMLNLMLQSLTLKGGEECVSDLGAIGFNPEMNQRFGKEMIAAITPIAQSSKDIALRRMLLGLMIRQKQYAEITKIGPKLLPDNGTELMQFEYIEATYMPWYIAESHENLGNLRQAETFYQLLGEYSQIPLFGRSSEQAEEYANHIMDWHLGRIAWKSGKSVEAIKRLQNVIEKQRGLQLSTLEGNEIAYHALAHNLLGEIYQSQGKKAEAKQQFEAAVKAEPEFRAPKDNLAKLK